MKVETIQLATREEAYERFGFPAMARDFLRGQAATITASLHQVLLVPVPGRCICATTALPDGRHFVHSIQNFN